MFLKYFAWSRNPCNSQSMGWVNSHSTEKSIEKNNHSKIMRLLKYFMWSRNPYNSQTTGWVISHIPELLWENTDNSHFPFCFTDLELMETHAITNAWECANSHTMEIFCGKPYHSPDCGFVRKLELISKFKQSPEHDSSKISMGFD